MFSSLSRARSLTATATDVAAFVSDTASGVRAPKTNRATTSARQKMTDADNTVKTSVRQDAGSGEGRIHLHHFFYFNFKWV